MSNNVLFIVTKSEVGGAQTWTNEMMKLIRDTATVHLVTSESGWLTEQQSYDSLLLLPQLKKKFNILGYLSLLKYIRNNKINTVVASSANAGIYARLARLIRQFKCIYVSHGWSCIYNGGLFTKFFIKVEKVLSCTTDIIWCVSKSDEIKAKDIIGISDAKIITLVNSVTMMSASISSENKKKIVFVGRLTHPKRPELLANVIAKYPDIELNFVGDGEYLTNLSDRYRESKNIHFLGEILNFSNYKDYGVFALISDSEGLPMSGLEAHTAGIPLLLSNVGGCNELIDGNGLLIENNENDLEEKLLNIINNYEVFYHVAQKTRLKFDFQGHKKKYEEIILN